MSTLTISDLTYANHMVSSFSGPKVVESVHATAEPKRVPAHTDDMRQLVERVCSRLPARREPAAFMMHGALVVHPALMQKMRRRIATEMQREASASLFGYAT